MGNRRTLFIVQAALFTSLTAIGALIRIPAWPVPITLQTLFVLLSGILLGGKYGALSQILYVAMGLAGVPILAEGGGLAYVMKPTFGYLLGFILCAWYTGTAFHKSENGISISESLQNLNAISNTKLIFHGLIGIFLIFIPGVIYLYVISNFYLGKGLIFSQALVVGCFNFILWDVVKVGMIIFVVKTLKRHW